MVLKTLGKKNISEKKLESQSDGGKQRKKFSHVSVSHADSSPMGPRAACKGERKIIIIIIISRM